MVRYSLRESLGGAQVGGVLPTFIDLYYSRESPRLP